MLDSMAQFLVITKNSLSLQSSPILRINHQRISKKNYLVLLRTLCKYLFFRRVSLQKKDITFAFIEALRLECDMEKNLAVANIIPFVTTSFAVYNDILYHMDYYQPYENRPILFNLSTYDFSFFDENFNLIDAVDDLPY